MKNWPTIWGKDQRSRWEDGILNLKQMMVSFKLVIKQLWVFRDLFCLKLNHLPDFTFEPKTKENQSKNGKKKFKKSKKSLLLDQNKEESESENDFEDKEVSFEGNCYCH